MCHTSRFMHVVAFIVVFAFVYLPVNAEVVNVTINSYTDPLVPGYTINDVMLTYTGTLLGQEILSQGLPAGSFFQDNSGSAYAFYPEWPPGLAQAGQAVEFDTFLTFGAWFWDDANFCQVSVAGEALVLGSTAGSYTFDQNLIDVAYLVLPSAPQQPPVGATDYPLARITIADSVNTGTVSFYFNADDGSGSDPLPSLIDPYTVVGGALVPEPATVGLLALGGIGLLVRRRKKK